MVKRLGNTAIAIALGILLSGAVANAEEIKTMTTTASLNIRNGAGIQYNVLGSYKENTNVEVISIENGWVRVSFNGNVAYCSADYLENTATKEVQAEPEIMLESTTYVNVRRGPDLSHEKLGMLSPRDKVKLIASEGVWNKVEYNGQEGYVSNSYVVLTNSDESNNKFYHYSKELSFTLDDFISGQAAKFNYSSKGGEINQETLNTYLNPDLILDRGNPYQFLRINKFRDNINTDKLNAYLNSLKHDTFHGKGQAFIDAAREYNIDTLYLVAHTILETGYGKSELARGVDYELPEGKSQEKSTVRVHNLFGIGAYDHDPVGEGAATAYGNGWTSIELAIKGGARWISENYIHSTKLGQNQYTLYMMRWNTNNYINPTRNAIWHQYATDVAWTDSVASLMKDLSYIYENAVLELEIPVFRKK
ncbi:N-acetylglucosaminidase [Alloiococcus sp. CFN-8]|uniref:N-acetylglucosaminidase n=1 Tax=Alloiococcus sp. CFN-8 TaxID=3416081 RepID=UPI003CF644AF